MKRDEAIAVIKELLDTCVGLDGRSVTLEPPASAVCGYQIIIRGILDEKTSTQMQAIIAKHQLAIQTGNMWKTKHAANKQPDTYIIYKSV